MNEITFPLKQRMQGAAVTDLQDALQVLLDRGVILRNDEAARRDLAAMLKRERSEQTYGSGTSKLVSSFQEERRLQPSGEVDAPTAEALNALLREWGLLDQADTPNSYIVRGQVLDADGRALEGFTVRAYDRDLRSEELLGEKATDAQGRYEIAYKTEQFRRAEKENADLIIRVVDSKGEEIASSDTVFNASPSETINIKVSAQRYRGVSEYEHHLIELRPLLENVQLHELTDADIGFLTGETGIPITQLDHLRLDAQWSLQYKIDPAVFYGLLRQGLSINLRRLLAEKPTRLRAALKTALAENIIPSALSARFEPTLDRLRRLAADLAFQPEADSQSHAPIGLILSTAPLAPELQRRVVDFSLQHEGDDLWDALASQADIKEDTLNTVRFTLESSQLLLSHVPTLQAVQKLKQDQSWRSSRDLARLKRSDWEGIAAGISAKDLPAGLQDAKAYAEAIAYRIEQAFPTAVVAHRLAEDQALSDSDINYFFATNPTFDLLHTSVEPFLNNGADLAQVGNRDGLSSKLKTFQRVARLTPDRNRFALMQGMLSNGYDSAIKIAATSPNDFLEKIVPIAGQPIARALLDSARTRADAANIALLNIRDYLFDGVFVLPRATGALPNLEKLFGSLSTCACKHCRSVYSPAAYLVDLLEFLKRAPRSSGADPFTVLGERRPDLGHIKLNCDNANTPLPYIDLVNEILELKVSPPAPGVSIYYQTVGSSEEARARLRAIPIPAHRHDDAYEVLANAVYPWNLPFNLVHEEIKLFSEIGDIKLYEVHELFRHSTETIAQAHLGMSARVWNLIANPAANDTDLATVWGFASASGLATLDQVPKIMARAQMTYEELERLISSRMFLRFSLAIHPGAKLCDVVDDRLMHRPAADVALVPLDATQRREVFDLIHRVIRLQRALSWSVERLSEVITARDLVHAGTRAIDLGLYNAIDLVGLYKLIRLAARLRLSVEDAARLNSSRLARAIGRSDMELAYLIELSGANPFDGGPESPFDLADLEVLLENSSAIDAAGLDPAELRYLLRHRDLTPAVFESTAAMREASLQGLYNAMRRSDPNFPVTGFDLVSDAVSIAVELAVSAHTNLLSSLRKEELNTEINRFALDIANRFDLVLRPEQRRIESASGDRIVGEVAVVEVRESLVRDYADVIARYPVLAPLRAETLDVIVGEFQERFKETFSREHSKWRKAIQTGVDHLATVVATSPEIVALLLLPHTDDEGRVARAALLHALDSESEAGIENFLVLVRRRDNDPLPDLAGEHLSDISKQFAEQMFIRLAKTARLIQLLGITAEELQFVATHAGEMGFLDFNLLPVAAGGSGASFESVLTLVRTKSIQATLPRADLTLFDLLDYARLPATALNGPNGLLDVLAKNTGWNQDPQTGMESAESLSLLNRTLGFTLADYRQPETYLRLKTVIDWMRKRRIPSETLPELVEPSTLRSSVERIAEGRFENDLDRYKAQTPGQDLLRKRKRDALVAYLIAKPESQWKDANSLYAHFLIDVEMSPCQLTSRIVQAYSAIQLFVQRCLMNLESSINLGGTEDGAHWKQWVWMKNYRVWEANRKVFLYPENWIEPDLRDDKSPFFKELENELLQDDVSHESVERVYRNYFSSFDDVARLDVRGLFEEEKAPGRKVLHVIGRTFAEPHTYYFRKRAEDRRWTAWEKIDLSIEGDHIIPVVRNGRTMLFWPKFHEIGPEESKRWEVSLTWSERNANGWQAPRVGSGKLRLPFLEKTDFAFRLDTAHIDLGIRVFRQVHVRSRDETVPESYSVGIDQFVLNTCTGEMETATASPILEFLHPDRMDAHGNRFIETNSSGDQLLVAFGGIADDLVSIDPDVLENLLKLLRTGNAGGILLFGSVLAALVLNQMKRAREQAGFGPLLSATPGRFTVVPSAQFPQFIAHQSFFVGMENRSYLVSPQLQRIISYKSGRPVFDWGFGPKYRFETFYHPYFCDMVRQLSEGGIDGILAPPEPPLLSAPSRGSLYRQLYKEPKATRFHDYEPTPKVWRDESAGTYDPYPYEQFDFSLDGAYSSYNWELFFHIPLLVADRLHKNQRFEEAQRWFHYIFDPTDVSTHLPPAKYWRVKPFFEEAMKWNGPAETLEDMMRRIAAGDDELAKQVEVWRNDPFNPHAIARMRMIAYMKTVVQKYLDNLIAWGDQLFQRDTMESINEATQLYILAAEILGPRPITLTVAETESLSYMEVEARGWDAFSNVLVDIESGLPGYLDASPSTANEIAPNLMLYFCIPFNEKLLSYWDTVADRLFKVRHCMNIEGQRRQLPLFAPPIDPALLVRARAMGLDLGDVIGQALDVRLPHYRYQYLSQKALEFCGEVRALGGGLLAALEKKDAEELSLLRSRHEISMLKLASVIKDRQIDEAKETLEGLRASRKLAETRLEFYTRQITEFRIPAEIANLEKLNEANNAELVGQSLRLGASIAHALPNVSVGAKGVDLIWGGTNVGNALSAAASIASIIATQHNFDATMSSISASHIRRRDDWDLQADLATKELIQIDKQILGAEIRMAIAETDKANHEKQIAQTEEVEGFLKTKFTNTQLYGWMAAQTSALHYQSYRMAFDLAKKAEKCLQHELGMESAFINFGHWDSMKKGLLAGEKLALDIKRMEVAYLDQNKREYELTKHVSLRQLDPVALLTLKATGTCEVTLPEWLFDLDAPGHYMRRIKTVSLSIPAVTGPYTNVNCTLSLLKSTLRRSPLGEYPRTEGEDSRFIDYYSTVQSIVTSNAQNDGGMFETNLRDERFLPFEGAGAESTWKLELPAEFRQFDYSSISDVILHLRYTARQGGGILAQRATNRLRMLVGPASTGLVQLFSLRYDFPSEWQRFVSHAEEDFRATIKKEYFPYLMQSGNIQIHGVELFRAQESELLPVVQGGEIMVDLTNSLRDNNAGVIVLTPDDVLIRELDAQVFLLIRYALGET